MGDKTDAEKKREYYLHLLSSNSLLLQVVIAASELTKEQLQMACDEKKKGT